MLDGHSFQSANKSLHKRASVCQQTNTNDTKPGNRCPYRCHDRPHDLVQLGLGIENDFIKFGHHGPGSKASQRPSLIFRGTRRVFTGETGKGYPTAGLQFFQNHDGVVLFLAQNVSGRGFDAFGGCRVLPIIKK